MLHNIKFIYLHCVFHGIRFKVNNEDWLSVKIAFFCFTRLMLFPPRSDHFIRIARSFGILSIFVYLKRFIVIKISLYGNVQSK